MEVIKEDVIPPPWDRATEVGFNRYHPVNPGHKQRAKVEQAMDLGTKFQRSVDKVFRLFDRTPGTNDNAPLFRLPANVRIKIFSLVLDLEDASRPIRMNPMTFNHAVWPAEYFDSFADAMAPHWRILDGVCFAFRVELLATILMTRRFHITFSPYVTPKVAPLILYIRRYGCLMQNITLEFDFTKLGYGPNQAVINLQPGTARISGLVRMFVRGQEDRRGVTRLENLTLLCRRFHGFRPLPNPFNDVDPYEPIRYVGTEHMRVLEELYNLSGLLESATFAGFTEPFSRTLLRRLYDDKPDDTVIRLDAAANAWRVCPSTAWPLLPGHSAFLDHGHEAGLRLCTYGCGPPVGLNPEYATFAGRVLSTAEKSAARAAHKAEEAGGLGPEGKLGNLTRSFARASLCEEGGYATGASEDDGKAVVNGDGATGDEKGDVGSDGEPKVSPELRVVAEDSMAGTEGSGSI